MFCSLIKYKSIYILKLFSDNIVSSMYAFTCLLPDPFYILTPLNSDFFSLFLENKQVNKKANQNKAKQIENQRRGTRKKK